MTKKYVSTKRASEIMISAGLISKNTRYSEQSTKRLITQGILKGNPPPSNQPKRGYQIDLDSINDYISIGKLNFGELVKLIIELKKENKVLKNKGSKQKQQKQNTKKILTLKQCLEELETKTALEVSIDLGRGKNYISDKLRGIGYKSERKHIDGKPRTFWKWTRDNKYPPLNANILEQNFVKEHLKDI